VTGTIASHSPLHVRLFGPVEVCVHGATLPRLRSRKGYWLLALLTLRPGSEVERAWVVATLWPESPLPAALANLRSSLKDLRHALGPEAWRLASPTPRTLRLDLEGAEVDALAFDASVRRGDRVSLEHAVSLHRGSLLEGCSEEWALPEREARKQAYLRALETLATHAAAAGEVSLAESYLRRAVATDPLRESAHRALMAALARSGSAAAAMESYRNLRLRLHREINAEPDAETQALFAQIRADARRRARGAASRSELIPAAALDLRPQNLPAQSTSLIGREQELARARELAGRDAVRLITFTGPGGMGKTRLALQLAAELLEEYPDGAFFVDLASITDPQRVIAAIAQVFSLRETADQPLADQVKAYLRRRHLVMLLDNFEQVLPAAPAVAELLTAAPQLKILVTSREALRLRAEHEFPVPRLQLPDRSDELSVEGLTQYASVALFIERALALNPHFAVTNDNAPAVTEICHRLEGLPLAIELAAARVKLFSPNTLLDRLDSRLTLLVNGPRDLPARQQTLRDAIAWSYNLLDEAEKTLFRHLSVFVNGCTLEAAEAVCRLDDAAALGLPEGLTSLVNKNLLRCEEAGGAGPRFAMLETIREYARECLAESGEMSHLQQQHAEYSARWTEEAIPSSQRGADAQWLNRCRGENDNLRAALAWTLERGTLPAEQGVTELGLRLAGNLGRFWEAGGHWSEGREWLERLLALSDATSRTATRARALYSLGVLLSRIEEHETALTLCTESLEIWRELGARAEIAQCLIRVSGLHRFFTHYELSRTHLEQAVTLHQALGDPEGVTIALQALGGQAFHLGDLDEASRLWGDCAARCRELGLPPNRHLGNLSIIARYRGEVDNSRRLLEECLELEKASQRHNGNAGTLNALADTAYHQGDLRAAADYWEQALPLSRLQEHLSTKAKPLQGLGCLARLRGELDLARSFFEEAFDILEGLSPESVARGENMGRVWMGMAQVACDQGDLAAARSAYRESVSWWQRWVWPKALPKFGPKVSIAACLEGLAIVAAKAGQFETAARAFSAAAAPREALDVRPPQPEAAERDRWIGVVRAALGDEAFAAVWQQGHPMSLEQAVAEALE
jgi:predicted ATPase/DNA-binding SARP family transcriptional activator